MIEFQHLGLSGTFVNCSLEILLFTKLSFDKVSEVCFILLYDEVIFVKVTLSHHNCWKCFIKRIDFLIVNIFCRQIKTWVIIESFAELLNCSVISCCLIRLTHCVITHTISGPVKLWITLNDNSFQFCLQRNINYKYTVYIYIIM